MITACGRLILFSEQSRLTAGMFTSRTDEWGTPQALFDSLHAEFNFTLDASATAENCKLARYFSLKDDGLRQSWAGERVFCNPPYSQARAWAAKCLAESRHALVVMLVPARTDTRWFHESVYGKAREIRFLKGRLHYNDGPQGAPFPSLIAIFGACE